METLGRVLVWGLGFRARVWGLGFQGLGIRVSFNVVHHSVLHMKPSLCPPWSLQHRHRVPLFWSLCFHSHEEELNWRGRAKPQIAHSTMNRHLRYFGFWVHSSKRARPAVCSVTPTARMSRSDRRFMPFRLYCVGASMYSYGHAPATYTSLRLEQSGISDIVPKPSKCLQKGHHYRVWGLGFLTCENNHSRQRKQK